MKLNILLLLLFIGAIAISSSYALTEPTVTDEDDRDDASPTSEAKDIEALKVKVADTKDKKKLADLKLKEAKKPFKPTLKLEEAIQNTTKAEEIFDDTTANVEDTNATLKEEEKEYAIANKTFTKSKKRDTMLRKKTKELKAKLEFAISKEMEVMGAHNKTVEHIEQHRVADARKQYAKAIKQDTANVDNLKAREIADKDMLKDLLQKIKKRLHGDDPHTQLLLQKVSDATRAIHGAAEGSTKYKEAKEIMKSTLHELYKINGKGDDLNKQKQEAKSLGKDIRKVRKDIEKAEEKAEEDVEILKEINATGTIPKNLTIQLSDGGATFEKKRMVIQEMALALNVTGLQKAYDATSKTYKKEHNTTFKEAKEMYNETEFALNQTKLKFFELLANLTIAQTNYKQDKRKSDTMTVAQKALRSFDIEYAQQDQQAAKFRKNELEAQLKRATEVLKVLKQASADADNVGTQVAAIKEKTKIKESDIKIPEFKRVDPVSIEDVEEKNLEKQSPIHVELAKLAKRIMWGTKPELYKTEIEKMVLTMKEKKDKEEAAAKAKADADAAKTESDNKLGANMKSLLKNSKNLKFKAITSAYANSEPLNAEPKHHCFDGKKDFGELGIDCGGTCARKCGFHHVSNIKVGSKDPYHKVSTIPNQELASANESEKPMMVKSLKELLVGNADVGGHPNMEPVMNDGKIQYVKHIKNSRDNNKDEKIRNWDTTHAGNRFKSSRKNHLRHVRKHHHHLRRHHQRK